MKLLSALILIFTASFSFATNFSSVELNDQIEMALENGQINADEVILIEQMLSEKGMTPGEIAEAIANFLNQAGERIGEGITFTRESITLTRQCVFAWVARQACYIANSTDEGDQACTDKWYATIQRTCVGE